MINLSDDLIDISHDNDLCNLDKLIIKLRLVNSYQISVDTSAKVNELDNLLNKINCTYQFDENKGVHSWLVNVNESGPLFNQLEIFKSSSLIPIRIKGKPWKPLLNILNRYLAFNGITYEQYSKNESNEQLFNKKLHKKLAPYQVEGAHFIIQREGSCLLADEIGLGKYEQAIAVADYFKGSWPLIIICPNALKYVWFYEIKNLLPFSHDYNIEIIENENSKKESINEKFLTQSTHIAIIDYESMEKYFHKLNKFDYFLIIVDEIYSLITDNVKFNLCKRLIARSHRRLLITSSPMFDNPKVMFDLFNVIDPVDFYGEFVKDLTERYTKLGIGNNITFQIQNRIEYKRLIHGTLFLRRTRVDVNQYLPYKQRKVIPLKLEANESDRATLKSLCKDLESFISDQKFAAPLRKSINKWYQISANIKSKIVEEYLKSFNNCSFMRVLCYYYHNHMANTIINYLKQNSVKYYLFDTELSFEESEKVLESYYKNLENNPNMIFLVVSLKCQYLDKLTLSADTILFTELHWKTSLLVKAEDTTQQEENSKPFIQYVRTVDERYHIDELLIKIITKRLEINDVNKSDCKTFDRSVIFDELFRFLRLGMDSNTEFFSTNCEEIFQPEESIECTKKYKKQNKRKSHVVNSDSSDSDDNMWASRKDPDFKPKYTQIEDDDDEEEEEEKETDEDELSEVSISEGDEDGKRKTRSTKRNRSESSDDDDDDDNDSESSGSSSDSESDSDSDTSSSDDSDNSKVSKRSKSNKRKHNKSSSRKYLRKKRKEAKKKKSVIKHAFEKIKEKRQKKNRFIL